MPGTETLQLALLALALLLVAARVRVVALRRRAGGAPARRAAQVRDRRAAAVRDRRAPPVRARRAAPARYAGADRVRPPRTELDEWPFPDPSAPAPTGLLPSTASARRRARALAASVDRR